MALENLVQISQLVTEIQNVGEIVFLFDSFLLSQKLIAKYDCTEKFPFVLLKYSAILFHSIYWWRKIPSRSYSACFEKKNPEIHFSGGIYTRIRRTACREASASRFRTLPETPRNITQHSIVLGGWRGDPLCRETPVSPTAVVSFTRLGKILQHNRRV